MASSSLSSCMAAVLGGVCSNAAQPLALAAIDRDDLGPAKLSALKEQVAGFRSMGSSGYAGEIQMVALEMAALKHTT